MTTKKIFSFVNVSENSMVASVRIARMVSRELKCPIVTDGTIADGKLDVLVIVNGAYAFCKYLAELGAAIEKARRVVWIQNDYTIIPPKPTSSAESPFRKAFRLRRERGQPDTDFWTTCEDWAKLTPGSRYVNWNCLTVDPDYDPKVIARRRKKAGSDLFYYGSWRAASGKSSRVRYFERYFTDPQVATTISSPAKQFAENFSRCKIIGPVRANFYEELASHGAGLYIEDRMSHERFHSPANRFYEMLSAGLPILFQPECGSMLRRAGYDPSPYVVERPAHVKRLMPRREEIGQEQRAAWMERALASSRALPGELRAAMRELEKQL